MTVAVEKPGVLRREIGKGTALSRVDVGEREGEGYPPWCPPSAPQSIYPLVRM